MKKFAENDEVHAVRNNLWSCRVISLKGCILMEIEGTFRGLFVEVSKDFVTVH